MMEKLTIEHDGSVSRVESSGMKKQIEDRRQAIIDRGKHAWNKEAQRFPVATREYKALLDLWEAAKNLYTQLDKVVPDVTRKDALYICLKESLEKLEKEG